MPRVILGIHEAHDASAAIMVDGRIVAAAQEERFSGLKGDYGFPRQAISACMEIAGVTSQDIDHVALASHAWNPVLTKIKRNANFTVDDWVKEQREYWYPHLFEGKDVDYYALYKDRSDFRYDDVYPMDDLLAGYMDSRELSTMKQRRRETASRLLNVPQDRIENVTHEDCHLYYAYFSSPIRGEALALTAEGIGDFSNATVNRMSERGLERIAHTRENHIGHIYQYITLLLGMKPAQHEYKVMGLAPYANERETARSYEVFKNILKLDGLNLVYDQKPGDLYFHFRDALEGHRFDGIAGALQKFTEENLKTWVGACVRETGLRRVVFAGGVAQNIKAVKSLLELDEVDEIVVCPAAGDTSLPIGACQHIEWKALSANGGDVGSIPPLETTYLGPAPVERDIVAAFERRNTRSDFEVREGVTAADVAGRLADGRIVARCAGPMEFGLRALGNRSILADPRQPGTVRRINDAIKFRDFWMPFTPSILAERADDYLVNPKGAASPFMTMAFDTTPLAQRELPAALHPGDMTARPQMLNREANPDYYDVIKAFEALTGVGGILNTSFNLHGEPIALGADEALHTFEESDLDDLVIGDFLVSRPSAAS